MICDSRTEGAMANIGIIAEYNPFHPGHAEQLMRIDEALSEGNNTKIALMSGNFVQRGEPAIYHKYLRAASALSGGVDLVLEYPFPYSCAPARDFAENAVYILESLGVIDYLCFGSECGDIDRLSRAADIISSVEFEKRLSQLIAVDKVTPYAKLRERAYTDISGGKLPCSANDILGIEYLSALRRLGSKMKPLVIHRKSHYTASAARAQIISGVHEDSKRPIVFDDLSKAIIPFLRMANAADLARSAEMNYDLARGVISAAKGARSLSEIVDRVTSKSYTAARIRRAILLSFFGVTPERIHEIAGSVRVLAAGKRGRECLREISKVSTLEIISTARKSGKELDCNDFSLLCDGIYALICDLPIDFYKEKPIVE